MRRTGHVAIDDRGAVEEEGFKGHLAQARRVGRLILGQRLPVRRIGATLAFSRLQPSQ
jgi:hypothetical protein